MPTQIATLTVKEGMMEDALAVLREIVTQVRENEPGIQAYIPHTVAGDGNENMIIFYEKYEDEDALQAHMAQLRTTLADIMPLLEPGFDLKVCTEII